jgi:hypothetical protein
MKCTGITAILLSTLAAAVVNSQKQDGGPVMGRAYV